MTFLILVSILLTEVEIPSIDWMIVDGGIKTDVLMAVVEDDEGNFIAVGYSASYSTGDYDGLILCLDGHSGDIRWRRTYGGTSNDRFFDLQKGSEGIFHICGETFSGGSGGSDGWLLCIDGDGEPIWETHYGGELNDAFKTLVLLPDGSIAAAGHTWSSGAGGSDAVVASFSNDGELQWETTLGGDREEQAWDMDFDGAYLYISGTTYSYGINGDVVIWCVDTSGLNLFGRIWGGPGYDFGKSVTLLPDGNLFVACWRKVASCQAGFRTVSRNGTLLGEKIISTGLDTRLEAVFTTDGELILATGYAEQLETSEQDGFLWEISPTDFERLWAMPLGGTGNDICRDVIETASGDIVIVGGSTSFGEGDMDAWVIRLERNDH